MIGYLASYLIIRQLRHNKRERTLDERKVNEEEEDEDEEEIMSTPECTKSTDQEGNHCYHGMSYKEINKKNCVASTITDCSQCTTLKRTSTPLFIK